VYVGVAIFPAYDSIAPAELAVRAEERGFESLWFPEHTHIPASRDTAAPRGGELPSHYWKTLDPFIALTAAAVATERLRLGTGVCLLVERDPITTAKEVATLDHVSQGRFLFGVGAGWNQEEMRNHGTDPRQRFAVLRERVLAMKAIWTQDEASFHGRHVDFERILAWPKPVQKPHPSVLVGGNGPRILERVLDYGDGWLPEPEADLISRIADLRRSAEQAGRALPVTVFGAEPDRLDDYAGAGCQRCVCWLRPGPPDQVRRELDDLARLAVPGGSP
jgi:probable F420-dependent oxidoreductase